MRRSLVLLALAAATGLLPALAVARSDVLTAEALPVGPFDRLAISGHAELVLVQGDREAVIVEASPRSRARVQVRAQDGRLTIEVGEQKSWFAWPGTGREPTITVHFRTLEQLSMSGAIKAAAGSITAGKLRIDASGAASVRVDALNAESLRFAGSGAVKGEFGGSVRDVDVAISGAGAFRAPKLATQASTVKVSGAGKVIVNAQKSLDASISGAGVIEYFGDPALKQRVSGAGRIVRRSTNEAGAGVLRVAGLQSSSAFAAERSGKPCIDC